MLVDSCFTTRRHLLAISFYTSPNLAAVLLLVLTLGAIPNLCHELHGQNGAATSHHECIHNQVRKEEIPVVYGIRTQHTDQPRRHIFTMQSAFSNIRINFFFDVDGTGTCQSVGQVVETYQSSQATCTEDDILTPAKRTYIVETLMPRAAAYLNSALNVDNVVGNLTVEPKCDDITLPAAQASYGVPNTDFAVYVTSVPRSVPSSAVAWARACMLDAATGRPLAGLINFIPASLTNAEKRDQAIADLDVKTGIHELCHALGYTAGFFGNYVDLTGVSRSDGLSIYYSSSLDKVVTKLVFPRALREARNYFGCQEMDGIEIEDDGGSGTAGTHWEKRVFYQEFIAGILTTSKTFVSSWTLAYFEDLGFYTANLEVAENSQMTFGSNAGCDFVNLRCNSPTVMNEGYCWDQDSSKKYCTADLLAGGYCGIVQGYSAIPSWEQYFSGQPDTGGIISIADYCPTTIAYSNSICISSTTRDSQDIHGNTYSFASRCFQSNLIQQDYSVGDISDTRCFPFSCSITGAILVNVKGQTVRCPRDLSAGAADTSRLVGFKGTIVCPAAAVLCPSSSLGPTPAPTPSPPTPQPTPAPPGYTPQPAIVEHSAKVWMTLNMPDLCSGREMCAANLSATTPECRLLALRLVQCFGTNCNSNLIQWLSDSGISKECRDPQTMATRCLEGYVGVGELCQLTSTSSVASARVASLAALALLALAALLA